jgi:Domain of unknown function (DUF4411)
MAYLLDANVFIQAKNLHYGFDFCPAFWDWLIARNDAGDVFSIERVGDEIDAGADELSGQQSAEPHFSCRPLRPFRRRWEPSARGQRGKVTTRQRSTPSCKLPTTTSSQRRSRTGIPW